MLHRLVTLPLGGFFRSQSFLAILAEQFADARLQFRRGPQGEDFPWRRQLGEHFQNGRQSVELSAAPRFDLAQARRDDAGGLMLELAQIRRQLVGQIQGDFHGPYQTL